MRERVTRPITKDQIRAIKAGQRSKGIDDDTYRDMLESGWGVRSCKDLTLAQANEVIAHLRGSGGQRKPKARRRQPIQNPAQPLRPDGDTVVLLATRAQHEFIADLAAEIRWEKEDGFQRWLERSLGAKRVRTRLEAARAIEGLKGLKRHGHSKEAP